MGSWELNRVFIDDDFLYQIPLTTTLRKAKQHLETAAANGQKIQKMGFKPGRLFKWFKLHDYGKTLAELGVVKGMEVWMRIAKRPEELDRRGQSRVGEEREASMDDD